MGLHRCFIMLRSIGKNSMYITAGEIKIQVGQRAIVIQVYNYRRDSSNY